MIKNSSKKKIKITRSTPLLVILILLISTLSGCIGTEEKTIKVSGAFALYPLMTKWADEYQKLNPDIKIDVQSGGAGKGMTDALNNMVNIGMVSREIHPSEIEKGAFWVSVTKDAVVATINTNNPSLSTILNKGLTKQQFIDIFINGNISTWGQLIGNSSITNTIKVYTRSDSCGAAETWAKYLGDYTQDDLTNAADAAINGDANLAATIQGDIYGIGYNNINYVYDAITQLPINNVLPVPIDINENGVLDSNESFYTNRTSMVNAIAKNQYPSPPARALNLVTKNNFTGIAKDFVFWILTEGQQYIPENGYIQLSDEIITTQIQYLEQGNRPETR